MSAKVDGWDVIIPKDTDFVVGLKALFFEVDSLIRQDRPALQSIGQQRVKKLLDDKGSTKTFPDGIPLKLQGN